MFKLTLVTPEKKLVTGQEVDYVTVPAFKGELNILPGHTPLITTLGTGVLEYKLKTGKEERIAVSWGYCQVSTEGINVLAETIESKHEVVEDEELAAIEEATLKLTSETLNDEDFNNQIARIERANARLKLLKH